MSPSPDSFHNPSPLSTVQSLSIHSPVWTFICGGKGRKRAKRGCGTDWIHFWYYFYHVISPDSSTSSTLCLSFPPSLSLSVNLGEMYDNAPVNTKKKEKKKKKKTEAKHVQPNPCLSPSPRKSLLYRFLTGLCSLSLARFKKSDDAAAHIGNSLFLSFPLPLSFAFSLSLSLSLSRTNTWTHIHAHTHTRA